MLKDISYFCAHGISWSIYWFPKEPVELAEKFYFPSLRLAGTIQCFLFFFFLSLSNIPIGICFGTKIRHIPNIKYAMTANLFFSRFYTNCQIMLEDDLSQEWGRFLREETFSIGKGVFFPSTCTSLKKRTYSPYNRTTNKLLQRFRF